MGLTVLFDEMIVILTGDVSSVPKRLFGEEEERNSVTRAVREIESPTATEERTLAEEVNTLRPEECRVSHEVFPASQNPLEP